MVVDADTDLFGSEAPEGVFGVTGIGGQRDLESPFLNGYTILPRSADDLSEPVQADFFVEDPWNTEDGPVPFENLSSGAGGYFWSFGDGTAPDTTTSPLHEYLTENTFTVVLTAQSQDGVCSDQMTQEVTVVFPDTSTIGIVEPEVDAPFRFGPNPFGVEDFGLTTEVALAGWVLLDGTGRRVMHGGALAPSDRLLLSSAALQAGWYTLQLTGADQRRWSLSVVRR